MKNKEKKTFSENLQCFYNHTWIINMNIYQCDWVKLPAINTSYRNYSANITLGQIDNDVWYNMFL